MALRDGRAGWAELLLLVALLVRRFALSRTKWIRVWCLKGGGENSLCMCLEKAQSGGKSGGEGVLASTWPSLRGSREFRHAPPTASGESSRRRMDIYCNIRVLS